MFKILGKLGKYLFLRFGQSDIAEMTRQQLQCFDKFEIVVRTEEEQEKFNRGACDLLENSIFLLVADEVIHNLKEHMLFKTAPENLIYDRFSINGVALLKERLNYYASFKLEVETEFDPHEL